ncbi:MAG TPA: SDR family oxidoreductase [Candidatus Nanoarchaeia archaeon]|nr:SDR family oxidoreductase [Candidatus Nanoarchaeia archaeon]
MDYTGKKVLITGSSNGIGLALATQFYGLGATVHGFDVQNPPRDCIDFHHQRVDITDDIDIRRGLSTIKGSIDILINNAGIMRRGKLLDLSRDDFEQLLHVNVIAPWMMLKYCQGRLSPEATIVQVSSALAHNPPENPSLYALTKRMAAGIAQRFAKDCPQYEVKFAYPGPVDTTMLTQDRSPEDARRVRKIAKKPDIIARLIFELLDQSDMDTLDYIDEDTGYVFTSSRKK